MEANRVSHDTALSPGGLDLTDVVELAGVGEPESLQLRRRELAAPGRGEALVRMEATGVSFAEQQMRRGKYYDQPAFPFVPGYDVVGVVERLGPPSSSRQDQVVVGQRVAALTKIGAWAQKLILDVDDLVPVPDGLEPAAAEAVIVNGITAWRMLHRAARVQRGETVVVLGATGGVGSILTQLAVLAGVRVIGVVSSGKLDAARALGAIPVDRQCEDVRRRVAELAPSGVAAVFDHVGGPGIQDSWKMLGRGGTLVAYGTASTRDVAGRSKLPVLKLIGRLAAWNLLPNGRRAMFFNLWKGRRRRRRFTSELREDLAQLLALVRDEQLVPEIAARFSLREAAAALRFTERAEHVGKVVLLAEPAA